MSNGPTSGLGGLVGVGKSAQAPSRSPVRPDTSGLVSIAGEQHIQGKKHFDGGATAPEPKDTSDVATKQYVDDAVRNLVPDSRTINGQSLSHNVKLTAKDVGAESDKQQPAGFKPADTQITGGFGDDYDAVITFVSSIAGDKDLTLTKPSSASEFAFIAVEPNAASHVTGIAIDGGLPALWDSKQVTIRGKAYTLFKSPYKFTQSPLTFIVSWK